MIDFLTMINTTPCCVHALLGATNNFYDLKSFLNHILTIVYLLIFYIVSFAVSENVISFLVLKKVLVHLLKST